MNSVINSQEASMVTTRCLHSSTRTVAGKATTSGDMEGLVPKNLAQRLQINGAAGLVSYLKGKPFPF